MNDCSPWTAHILHADKDRVLNIVRVADSIAPVLKWSLDYGRDYGEVFEGVLTFLGRRPSLTSPRGATCRYVADSIIIMRPPFQVFSGSMVYLSDQRSESLEAAEMNLQGCRFGAAATLGQYKVDEDKASD